MIQIDVEIEHTRLFEKQLRKFKKLTEKEGIIDECYRRQAYYKPSQEYKKKHMRAKFR